METRRAYCEVRTELLNTVQNNFVLLVREFNAVY
jgi:hypothetical protein